MSDQLSWGAGLRIGYERYGEGPRKVFYVHGFPGSRFQGRFLEPHCKELGIEVVAFERPGYGLSEHPGKATSLLSTAQMVEAMAGQLGWRRFHLIGVSGGAPYALGAASHLPDRVASIHLVCGLGPLSDPEFRAVFPRRFHMTMRMMRRVPSPVLHRLIRRRIGRAQPDPDKDHPFLPGLSLVDQQVISRPEIFPAIQKSLEAAFSQGVLGAKNDLRIYLKPWCLDWKSIQCPTQVWHGLEDHLIPPKFSEIFASRIAPSQLKLVPGEGHYSLPIRRAREILACIG
jgi:pimeloyl-ACP methyl ester carboxylesterase